MIPYSEQVQAVAALPAYDPAWQPTVTFLGVDAIACPCCPHRGVDRPARCAFCFRHAIRVAVNPFSGLVPVCERCR